MIMYLWQEDHSSPPTEKSSFLLAKIYITRANYRRIKIDETVCTSQQIELEASEINILHNDYIYQKAEITRQIGADILIFNSNCCCFEMNAQFNFVHF